MTLPTKELSTPAPETLSEWLETEHNLDSATARDQASKMTAFFTALTTRPYAPSKTPANLN